MLLCILERVLLAVLLFAANTLPLNSGYWYGGTRPPNLKYDSVPYANLTVRIDRSYFEGPGQYLVSDPLMGSNSSLYTGLTINRQTFDTQFVLDMSMALSLDVDRIFVMYVYPGKVHFSWETKNVIVNFIFLERNNTQSNTTLLEAIASLTNQIQDKGSPLYTGNVTKDIDSLWGLQEVNWDISLKLTYAISVIGGDTVIDGYYLNQGSLQLCDTDLSAQNPEYCEFQRFFEDDVSRALNISSYRVRILFIKQAAYDAVLVHFRMMPQMRNSQEVTAAVAIANLVLQVNDMNSELYKGNVTIRVDSLWGVSGQYGVPRVQESFFTWKWYEYDSSRLLNPSRSRRITSYDRCKANRRCNWGQYIWNQSENQPTFYHQLFDEGQYFPVDLFLDFEDWRMGSWGFNFEGSKPLTESSGKLVRGAHFNPFNATSLGPDIPCYMQERNQGLILDRQLQTYQIGWQNSLVNDLSGRVEWISDNIEWSKMGPVLRSRKDVKRHQSDIRATYNRWLDNEIEELKELNSSMCASVRCTITFNTSSFELTGAIQGTGNLGYTDAGTEVAIFAFNSIYLGPETEVILCGQRALTLVSKTIAIINTTFHAIPGTLGGFPGGYSVGRTEFDALSDSPTDIIICELAGYCDPTVYNKTSETSVSNNINGPGSGNLRVHPYVITTTADVSPEIQFITTNAQQGQTLAGGFVLHFHAYSTPVIPHDVSALDLKSIIEKNLNMITPEDGDANIRPTRGIKSTRRAGVGIVNVTRSFQNDQEGYTWNITFTTAIGNIDQIKVTSYLEALNATVYTGTIRDGNEILGGFRLEFMGEYTDIISSYETAATFKQKLLGLANVRTAFVNRIDPTENCDDGLCPDGPLNARGMIWTIFITSNSTDDNYTPYSPTSPIATLEAPKWNLTAEASGLVGEGVTLTITKGTGDSPDDMMKLLNLTVPFSIAYGGAGGSYGGYGGVGYSDNPVGVLYNDEILSDLLGGSGGCMRSQDPFEINAYLGPPSGRGGHGGGAIEIIAPNDIWIGSYGAILTKGGDGEQTSQGGGGGGSGGSIVLAAGGAVIIEGVLDASGGRGGYGGPGLRKYLKEDEIKQLDPDSLESRTLDSMSGGGGGGGRIAIYAESIIPVGNGIARSIGGSCGILKTLMNESVVYMNISILMGLVIPLNSERVVYLGATFINQTVSTLFVNEYEINSNVHSDITYIEVKYSVVLSRGWNASVVNDLFNITNGTLIGEVLMTDYHIVSFSTGYLSYMVETQPKCFNPGQPGTVFESATMTTLMRVAPTDGAEYTRHALFLSNNEVTRTASGSKREAPFIGNGPAILFNASRPTRITYYTLLESVPGLSIKSSFGTLFALQSGVDNIIGVYVCDQGIMQGANFRVNVDDAYFLKRFVTIDQYPAFNAWYKVDIHIDWSSKTYYLLLNDVVVTSGQRFVADSLDSIRLSINRAANVWYDEIYVGFDNTMGFKCPQVKRNSVVSETPVQYGWTLDEVNEKENGEVIDGNIISPMMRHYNYLDPGGQVAFDGQGLKTLFQDFKYKYPSGDYLAAPGRLHAGAMVYITDSLRSAKYASGISATLVSPQGLWYQASPGDQKGGAGDGRQFVYAEHDYVSPISSMSSLNGGIAACSSDQMLTWRFEGIVFHYVNMSDMVYGLSGPFSMSRPRVLFNPTTKFYVMWSAFDNVNRSLAMNSVLYSPYEDGPFLLRRTFYPDGNLTRDQVIYQVPQGTQVVLGRTYYATIEYVLPDAMMQPSWESAKDTTGVTSYSLSYQRSAYQIGYDNYHDIFEQRWRKEDKPYSVYCVNKATLATRLVPPGVVNSEKMVCNDPEEYKVIEGQGLDPTTGLPQELLTKFVSPKDPRNSWWKQTSVPAVRAQPWSNAYRDGYCGLTILNDNFEIEDPDLATPNFKIKDRSTCSNIADNPVHDALPDKLIGVQRVKFRRRTKFIALSALTPDYMDTSGFLNVYEGEYDSGNLVSLISQMGQFYFQVDATFTNNTQFRTTFPAPVRSEYETATDYNYRFRQYMQNYNDRATYALACAIDDICPVNFLQQVNIKD